MYLVIFEVDRWNPTSSGWGEPTAFPGSFDGPEAEEVDSLGVKGERRGGREGQAVSQSVKEVVLMHRKVAI